MATHRAEGGGLRLAALLLGLVGLYAVARATGATDHLTRDAIRGAVERAGPLGPFVFLAAFVVGTFVHVPGLVLVGAGVAGWGPALGGLLSFGAGVVAVTVTFVIVRALGGRALAEPRSPLLRRLMAPLEARPVRTVIVLRTVLIISPPLNYTLALSPIRLADYVVGSAIGLAAPVAAASYVLGFVFP